MAVVQARMTSTRFPGKVLASLAGRPALHLLLERLVRASELDGVVVATSTDPTDDAVAVAAEAAGVDVLRGPLDDVLERYRIAGETIGCDAIVRITADCPLIDPRTVDLVVRRWREGTEDYVANCFEPRTYPPGFDTEVVSRQALVTAAAEATDPEDREHVTPFIRGRPERFTQAKVELNPPAGRIRLVLDTPEDLEYLRSLVAEVGPDASGDEILEAAGRITRVSR